MRSPAPTVSPRWIASALPGLFCALPFSSLPPPWKSPLLCSTGFYPHCVVSTARPRRLSCRRGYVSRASYSSTAASVSFPACICLVRTKDRFFRSFCLGRLLTSQPHFFRLRFFCIPSYTSGIANVGLKWILPSRGTPRHPVFQQPPKNQPAEPQQNVAGEGIG